MTGRRFLFLQGPASPFMKKLAQVLETQGSSVLKVSLCIGDVVFWWPKKSPLFRGRQKDWAVYLDCYITDHNITDIVMLGDGRAPHATAARIGMERGLRVHILEHGYLRPDWLTIEPDGMSAHSRFPQDANQIAALADQAPPVPAGGLYRSSFLTYALYDLAFHIPNVLFGWLVHPHYKQHGPVHPVIEYSGWVWKALTLRKRRARAEQAINACLATDKGREIPFFLFPLQLPGDYQIIRHAPGGNLFRLVEATIASFAKHAPAETRLLFKVHPIDNGLSRWPERIAETAARHGISDRVFLADGGNTDELIRKSAGVVTVNSTVGLTALIAGRPVIALGAAIYDVPGLTFQDSLADFWRYPITPDPDLLDAFLRALAATTQVRGGFIGEAAITAGAENVAARLLEEEERLPIALRKPQGMPRFRYAEELGQS
ncbi:capsule biosynthesis protein [Neorhizobium alkalisoli]|uniref:Capsular polysaccharide export protein n=1 Tax=Neorhizobium alkalisoli TaxID=528178 RepID=A0A561R1S2_9HYPH|nr:capsular biosynthesis protein [Neorhizobium alkalisoli]TWF56561.1 capsular polysaccharide export protein [Neorhizobium alkalisoli]